MTAPLYTTDENGRLYVDVDAAIAQLKDTVGEDDLVLRFFRNVRAIAEEKFLNLAPPD
jgi:hypothetical protein